ncbi:hypothetical protein V2G26_008553 [Clonostachys chloroleuca]
MSSSNTTTAVTPRSRAPATRMPGRIAQRTSHSYQQMYDAMIFTYLSKYGLASGIYSRFDGTRKLEKQGTCSQDAQYHPSPAPHI